MAPTRPEFFYHPAFGVVSPESLRLFAFKNAPLTYTTPTLNSASDPKPTPKPLVRATPPVQPLETRAEMMSQVSPAIMIQEELTMPKIKTGEVEICIVTGEELPTNQMIRFVVGPENTIYPDLTEKLPGDAFWIKADKDILKKAIWRNSFTTAARRAVIVPKNLAEQIHLGLLRLSMETLNLARKAGLLTQGFAKCEEVLKERRATLYIVASDAKENGREKLEKLSGPLPILTNWTSSQLSAALGLDNAVHIVLTDGTLTRKLLNLSLKLKDFQ